ncbi:MAG: leucine-rich repeat protein [Bacteroidota bacterium]|nr:leucine-rich repeat protein [Bacteroidota bacterium]
MSTHGQKTREVSSDLCFSSRFRKGVLSFRLSQVFSLVALLSLLLPGQVLAQVSEHVSSEETDFKKERGWEETITSTRTTPYRDDRIREERFRLRSEAFGLVLDRLWSEMPVNGSSAVKPVAHMSLNICDRTAAVMDAILSRIAATNNCSEVTSTQLAGITGTLDLSTQNISSLKAGDFDGLTSLTRLDLDENDLSTLPHGVFNELTSLTRLDLSANDLVRLPDDIFDRLTSLTSLYLDENDLSALPDGLFDELTSLTRLYLEGNDLSTLPDGIFDTPISLAFLYLHRNDLSTLPGGIFDELTSLTYLGLDENDLSTLSEDIFDELTSLISLRLWGNGLSMLPDGIFDQLSSLIVLYLHENDLSTLPGGIFDELTSLTTLELGANDLSTLPDGIFDELTSLKSLRLRSNDLSLLSDGIFDKLTSLTWLELWGNDLSVLPDGIFDNLTSLLYLELRNNDLSTLPDGIFDELTSLTSLHLGANDLSTLPDGLFDELTSLRMLSLRNNDLVTLSDGIFKNLTQLPLDNNTDPFSGLSLQDNPGAPFRPVVNAGADLMVQPGAIVSIPGSVTGPWGDIVRWEWIQVNGPDSDTQMSGALPLTGRDTATPTFAAPMAEGELHFRLVAVPGHKGAPAESLGHANSDPDWVTVRVATATNTTEPPSVVEFNLLGNYPDPFNPSTTILLDVPQVAAVTVDVFNLLGQWVHREEFPAVSVGASKSLPLDVSHLSSGAYIYQVTARMGEEVHRAGGRMTLIK